MSRAKTTKRAKQYSATHMYRHFTDLSNHARNAVAQTGHRNLHQDNRSVAIHTEPAAECWCWVREFGS